MVMLWAITRLYEGESSSKRRPVWTKLGWKRWRVEGWKKNTKTQQVWKTWETAWLTTFGWGLTSQITIKTPASQMCCHWDVSAAQVVFIAVWSPKGQVHCKQQRASWFGLFWSSCTNMRTQNFEQGHVSILFTIIIPLVFYFHLIENLSGWRHGLLSLLRSLVVEKATHWLSI